MFFFLQVNHWFLLKLHSWKMWLKQYRWITFYQVGGEMVLSYHSLLNNSTQEVLWDEPPIAEYEATCALFYSISSTQVNIRMIIIFSPKIIWFQFNFGFNSSLHRSVQPGFLLLFELSWTSFFQDLTIFSSISHTVVMRFFCLQFLECCGSAFLAISSTKIT